MIAPLIALLTDFGERDWYVGAMKAVLASQAPGIQILDLCHGVPPQNVASGAFVLRANTEFLPAASVILAVVDPGVGGSRRPVALRSGGHLFVGPDNGLFSGLLDAPDLSAVEIEAEKLAIDTISPTFQGRDLFAPAAAQLARGEALSSLGPPAEGLIRGETPWRKEGAEWIAPVLWVDRFGNLITGLPASSFEGETIQAQVGTSLLEGLCRTFSDVEIGEALAYVGSCGTLEIALREGNASQGLGMEVGAEIRIRALASEGSSK